MTSRVLFYIQHLLGIGHLRRGALIAEAMAAQGLDVTVALGGPPVPGIAFKGCSRIPLPVARAADEQFSGLVDEDGKPVDDEWRDRRMSRLLAEYEALQPHVLLIEMFPFGRRQFRFELMPLIEQARASRPRPRIICSLRDVLVAKWDPDRNQEMVTLAWAWFDWILVHGDPSLLPLDASFPEAVHLRDRILYTGYVVDDSATENDPVPATRTEVVVSAGGGAVGEPLIEAALAARPLSKAASHVWRIITGPNLSQETFDRLRFEAPDGVIIERWREDFAELLKGAALSISQAGYNTVMDILQTRVPAIVVPFATEKETEQEFRAQALADRGQLIVIDPRELSPEVLAAAIDEALSFAPPSLTLDLNGAATTARLVGQMCFDAVAD